MTFAASFISRAAIQALATRSAAALDLDTNAHKYAIWGNTPTPDKDASPITYGAGQFIVGNELSNGSWPVAGVTLANKVVDTPVSGRIRWDADDPTAGPSVTLTGIYGGTAFDTSASNQIICGNSFGGTNSVTAAPLLLALSSSLGLMSLNV